MCMQSQSVEYASPWRKPWVTNQIKTQLVRCRFSFGYLFSNLAKARSIAIRPPARNIYSIASGSTFYLINNYSRPVV